MTDRQAALVEKLCDAMFTSDPYEAQLYLVVSMLSKMTVDRFGCSFPFDRENHGILIHKLHKHFGLGLASIVIRWNHYLDYCGQWNMKVDLPHFYHWIETKMYNQDKKTDNILLFKGRQQ
jgi:hypothetical protein